MLAASSAVVSCGGEDADQNEQTLEESRQDRITGELRISANGEDFVRSGFISMDGWNITFRHLYVTIADITAYQTNPPYDPSSETEIISDVQVEMEGVFTIDLLDWDMETELVPVGTLEEVPDGHYNALSWSMIPALEGPSEGYSIYIDAQAGKGDQSYNVILGFESSYEYFGGEFVGDERKGFVSPEGSGELEITLHFDHIFGDIELTSNSELNSMAVGFDPFADLMQEGSVYENLSSLSDNLSEETFHKLIEVLPTLGHTGEGHCFCRIIQ